MDELVSPPHDYDEIFTTFGEIYKSAVGRTA